MPRLSLSVLGPFTAHFDERPYTQFRTKSVQALLVYLACQPEAHSREQLMALLWPGPPQKSAQGSLRQTLYLLRKAIPELPSQNGDGTVPLLLTDRKTVQMNPDGRFDLDLRTFTDKLKGDESGWAAAVDLYLGDFLADFYLPDSAPFEEWTLARRADLRRQVLEALEMLTDYTAQIGDLAAAETHARRQLEIDNLRESAHRQLMEILARNGRRRAAISQYEALAQLLHDELAIEPTASTQTLYKAIRGGKFDGTAVPTPPTLAPAAPKRLTHDHNLPVQTTPFFGREAEMSVLNELMDNPEIRLITIVGPGGMGKTRLALEIARGRLENFDQGVWFTSLAKLSSPNEIVQAAAQALHFNFYEGGTPRQQLLDYLRNKSLLLVLDNYEHLLEGADLVTDILQEAPRVVILVTSREPLRLVEEQLFPLSGLTFSRKDVVEWDAAVQLFLDRARRLRPDLTFQAADISCITTICRQVDGMPLGLELAAAWVDTFSLADIASELQQSLDLLESDMRNIVDRHRSLRAVFDASWDRLPSSEQQLFAQMSVFRGGFTRLAAWEICAPNLRQPAFHRLLAALTRKSFLKHDRENGRYDIHELMRQYGAEKLAQSLEKHEETKDRHSSFYCAFLQKQDAKLKGPHQKEAIAEIELEHENAHIAWEWAVRQERIDWLDQALDGLCRFYEWQSRRQVLEPMCRLASEKLIPSASGDGLRVLARILTWQGLLLPNDEDLQLLQQSLSLLEKPELADCDTRAEQAFTLRRLAGLTTETEVALKLLNQSLALYQELGDQWSEAQVLEWLAWVGSTASGFDQKEQWARDSLTIRQSLDDQLGIAKSWEQLARFAREQGQNEKAEKLYHQSLNLYQMLGNQSFIASGLFSMAFLHGYNGRFVECQSFLKDTLEIANDLGIRSSAASAYQVLGWATIHLGNYTQAREYLKISLSIYLEINPQFGQGLNLADSSMIELAEEKYGEVKTLSQKGLTIFQNLDVTYMAGFVLAYLAYAERGLDNPDASRQYIIEALKLTIKSGVLETLLETLPPAALLLADWGKKEQALEIYSLAMRRPYVANSQWFEDVAGQHIKAIAASLPPEAAKAAEKRGRARDFWETANELLIQDFAQAPVMDEVKKQSLLAKDKMPQQAVEPMTASHRFAQKSLIAVGGHGELYLGEDTVTGKQVVIKRIKSDLVTQHPEIVARFIREGEALRKLNHPNIVKMIAAEEHDGMQLIVMEYMPGGSLRQLLDAKGQLSIIRVLDIGLELADALTRAHHLGIIHRDIKPANILLAEDGTPRLTDFGIARVIQQQTRLTQEGAFLGSPVYMSPEACRGESLGFRSDIWSFGALLYEMLAGHPPFATEQIAATLVAILNDPIPDLTQFRPDVPLALASLIHSMLAKEQEKRIGSVRQVAVSLETIRNSLVDS